MSEFISLCPKCRQQILCDTAYVGCRVACPVCLQEIIMPKPQGQQTAEGAHAQSSQPGQAAAAKGKSSGMKMGLIIGGVVLVAILAVGGVLLTRSKAPETGAAAPAPTATPTPVAAAEPLGPASFFTNRLTLETSSSIVKIIEVRQKNAKRCVDVFYDCIQKRSQLEIVIKGIDTYAPDPTGGLGKFEGWTFKNNDYTYFVSAEGRLTVSQGSKRLISENGTWTEQHYELKPPDRL